MNSRLAQRLTLGIVLLGSSLCGGSVRAESKNDRAKAHFEKGSALFHLTKFKEALTEFEAAFVLKPDPVFIYNIAQCHRLAGSHNEAILFYRKYLKLAPPNAHSRAEVEKRIRELEALVAGDSMARTAPPTTLSTPSQDPMPATGAQAPASSAVPASFAAPASASAPPGGASAPVGPLAAAPARGPESVPPAAITDEPASTPSAAVPITSRWWFWTGIGAVVLGGVATGLLLASGGDDPSCPAGWTCPNR